MVYSTSFLLIPAYWLWVVPHFIKKVKDHKARQKLETLNKEKARKAPKKRKARKKRKHAGTQASKAREHVRYVGT